LPINLDVLTATMQKEELEALGYHALEAANIASKDGDPLYFTLKSNGEYFVRGTFSVDSLDTQIV